MLCFNLGRVASNKAFGKHSGPSTEDMKKKESEDEEEINGNGDGVEK